MAIYLVRHAKAGSRSAWVGDDRVRPLSKAGWRQAEALKEALAPFGPSLLVSSPYLRCVQTLKPLSRKLHLPVQEDDCLAEAEAFEPVLKLLRKVPEGGVVCSHGDVIPEVMQAMVRRGIEVTTAPDWRKATVWVLERDGKQFTSAACWPPPDIGLDVAPND